MSHSQFHSTNLFILRHAWLNLWDKHMTTGRINQVTISVCTEKSRRPSAQHRYSRQRHFLRWVFVTRLQKCLCEFLCNQRQYSAETDVLTCQRPANETPCSPFSQVSDQLSLFREQRSRSSVRTTSNRQYLKNTAQSRRIPDSLIAYWCNHR